jgi:hypothetical protein
MALVRIDADLWLLVFEQVLGPPPDPWNHTLRTPSQRILPLLSVCRQWKVPDPYPHP